MMLTKLRLRRLCVLASFLQTPTTSQSFGYTNGTEGSDPNDSAGSYYERYHRIFQGHSLDNNSLPLNTDSHMDEYHVDKQTEVSRQGENAKLKPSTLLSDVLTHTHKDGKLNMVDVGHKPESDRTATAFCKIILGEKAFNLVETNSIQKGDVLTVARIAGIMAAKKTSSMIPLCHTISLTKVDVDLKLEAAEHSIHLFCTAKTQGKTGAEMEALVGVTTAALTVYDMCKAVNREMVIRDVTIVKKTGGVRGDFELAKDSFGSTVIGQE